MINFISFNKGNENMIIYQCQNLIDMIICEAIGDTVQHKSGRDITTTVKEWRGQIAPIKWDVETFESAVNTYSPKEMERCEDCGNYLTYKGAFVHCDCDKSHPRQFGQSIL